MNKEHDINKNIEWEKYMFYNGKGQKLTCMCRLNVRRKKNVVKLHFFHVLAQVFCTIVLRKSEEVKENLTKKHLM